LSAQRARLVLYQDTFHIFLDFPLTGTGLGTFVNIFPMYQSFVTNDTYLYAHNDYLEALSENGILVAILILILLGECHSRLAELFSQEMSRARLAQLASFCALFSVGLHSLTDFSFQIPAVALGCFLIAALFWKPLPHEAKVF
jgi:O-antigen ligase